MPHLVAPMRILIVVGLLIATIGLAAAAEVFTSTQPGEWSARGVYLWPGPTAIADLPSGGRALRIVGPDGKTVLQVGDIEARVTLPSGKQSSRFGILSLAEILWAANATVFALTESDGGWVGSWSVRVGQISPSGKISFHEIDRRVSNDFFARISKRQCPEYANVGGIAWAKGAEELLVIAEAPPHSSCPVMTAVCGYVVAVPSGVIRRRLSPQTLKREWSKALGTRLYRIKEANHSAAPGAKDGLIQIDCGDTSPRRG